MNITNEQLRNIIQEELESVLNEKRRTAIPKRQRKEVQKYLSKLVELISTGPFQRLKNEFFFDNHSRRNFTIDDALRQVSGELVDPKSEAPWGRISLGGQTYATKEIIQNYPMYKQKIDLFYGEKPDLIIWNLVLKRSGEFYFEMRLLVGDKDAPHRSMEMDELMRIEGENLFDNLSQVLTYCVMPANELFAVVNKLYDEVGAENLPKTSLP